jgi:quinol monooxygenase YgiN
MEIPADDENELLQSLLMISERMCFEDGCIGCGLFKDVSYENRYRLIGKWIKEDDLNKHMQSEEFNFLFGALSFIEKQPRMRLDVVSSIPGTETLH